MLAYIELNTPFDPGNYDPDGYSYPHCFVTHMNIYASERIIKLFAEYGTMSTPDGYVYGWERGMASKDEVFYIEGDDYDLIIVDSNSEAAAHQWILDTTGNLGTVIDIE